MFGANETLFIFQALSKASAWTRLIWPLMLRPFWYFVPDFSWTSLLLVASGDSRFAHSVLFTLALKVFDDCNIVRTMFSGPRNVEVLAILFDDSFCARIFAKDFLSTRSFEIPGLDSRSWNSLISDRSGGERPDCRMAFWKKKAFRESSRSEEKA